MTAAARHSAPQVQIRAAIAGLPLYFEQNRGQAPADALYVARGHGFAAAFNKREVLIQLGRDQAAQEISYQPCKTLRCLEDSSRGKSFSKAGSNQAGNNSNQLLRIHWAQSEKAQPVHGAGISDARVHYLTGNDPKQWNQNVSVFSQVVYPQVQPGIDLIFYGRQQQMEFDLIVSPGADPESFTMTVDGADSLSLADDGELRITADGESFMWKRPLVYQELSTPGGDIRQRMEIAGNYRLEGQNRLSFVVGDYDHSQPLIIDPVLQYGSYLGGNSSDQIQGIAIDAQGNIYVTGTSYSANFPTASALRNTKSTGADMFISKLNPSGTSLIYSTFLGGNGDEGVQRLGLAADGSVTVAGYTTSSNFPLQSPAQANYGGATDAAVARISANGSSLIYSTYLGGTGEDASLAMALDSSGAAYVTGYTRSNNFPTVNPFRASGSGSSEVFVSKFTTAGVLAYSTYLGGNAGDIALGIAADSTGSIFVAGTTTSTNYPVSNAIQSTPAGGQCSDAGTVFPCGDVFFTRIAASGTSLLYSTYLGGTGDEQANALTIDASNAAYLTGYTTSTNFPTRTPIQASLGGLSDAFVTKISPAGTSLVYSTFLGGAVSDTGTAIAVDSNGTAYVTGSTESSNFPTVNTLQPRFGVDAFVSRLNPAGSSMSYSTFLGGSDFDQALAIAADNNGNAYIAGWTNSDDFPRRTPLQSALGGGTCGTAPLQYICEDGFIARITHQPGLFAGGMVNGASFAPNAPVAAGSIVSAFGSDLSATDSAAAAVPLPLNLGGVSITMNGIPAPLFFVGNGQVNLQVPWELAGQNSATIMASSGGVVISQTTVSLGAARPGIFTTNAQGTGQGAILIANSTDLAAPVGAIPGRTSRPARRGESITIFCTGLGPVNNRPATGAAGPGGPLAVTTATPQVNIGGGTATVSFSGLAPGFVGLYQVNVAVPNNAPQQGNVPVVVIMNGVASNSVDIAVQ